MLHFSNTLSKTEVDVGSFCLKCKLLVEKWLSELALVFHNHLHSLLLKVKDWKER